MTEKQWLRSRDAEAMNRFYGDRLTERKARLLMLAACRRHPGPLAHPDVRPILDLLVSHYADPRTPDAPFTGPHLTAAYRKIERHASATDNGPDRGLAFGLVAAAEPVSTMRRLNEDFEYLVFSCLHDIAVGVTEDRNPKKESKAQAALVREVIGNPFRPVALDPAWLTGTVVSLARLAHESEDFTAMPILADALQDAGCEDADMLTHCRDPKQTHVRGCWVLDLILAATAESAPARKRKGRA
ncbi:hypothetical protein [Gemmata sp.]|uniref:hypothetical protein n=1 Tax=Gemmata sp. TaxID=1914242 RepID=UPI003F70A961